MKLTLLFALFFIITQLSIAQTSVFDQRQKTWDQINELSQKLHKAKQNNESVDHILTKIQFLEKQLEYTMSQLNNLVIQKNKAYFKSSEDYYYWKYSDQDWIHRGKLLTPAYDEFGNTGEMVYEIYDDDIGNWVNDYRFLFTYNAQHKMIEKLEQHWNGEEWTDYEKEIYAYNGVQSWYTSFESYYWYEPLQTWNGLNNWEDTYDDQGRWIQTIVKDWDYDADIWYDCEKKTKIYYETEACEYINYYKNTDDDVWEQYYLSSYDENGNRIEYYEKGWDPFNNEFNGGYREIKEYINNFISTLVIYHLDNDINAWLEDVKFEYFYDEQQNNFETRHYNWQAKGWELYGRDSAVYNQNNEKIENYFMLFDRSDWFTIYKELYSYIYTDTTTTTETVYQHLPSNGWDNYRKTIYTHSTDQNYTYFYYYYNWNESGQHWALENVNKEHISYNSYGLTLHHYLISFLYSQGWEGFSYNYDYDESLNLVRELRLTNAGTEYDFINNQKYEYSYIFIDTDVSQLFANQDQILLFQNPYKKNTPIRFSTKLSNEAFKLELFNISGQKVFGKNFKNGEVVHINKNINEGLYFIIISSEEQVVAKQKIFVLQ